MGLRSAPEKKTAASSAKNWGWRNDMGLLKNRTAAARQVVRIAGRNGYCVGTAGVSCICNGSARSAGKHTQLLLSQCGIDSRDKTAGDLESAIPGGFKRASGLGSGREQRLEMGLDGFL